MKRFLLGVSVVVLLAAGCNSSQPVSSQQPVPTPAAQTATPTETLVPTTSPTPASQTTGLKTYTDSTEGFQFQYPSDWNLLTCDPAKSGGAVVFFNADPLSDACYGNNDSFGSIYVSTVQDLGNPGYGTPYNECVQNNLDNKNTETDISVDGTPAKEFVSGSPASITAESKEVCFVHGSGRSYYDLQINQPGSQSSGVSSSVMDSRFEGFDTIVSTFKFTTSAASSK